MRITLAFSFLSLFLASCCEPGIKDSFPVIDYASYSDTLYKDVLPVFMDSTVPRDSGYYVKFSFNVINSGSDSDNFVLKVIRNGAGFMLERGVGAHDTARFSSPPIEMDFTVEPPRYVYYETFFERDSALAHLSRLRPEMTIRYGEINLGPEGCNTEANTFIVAPEQFQ